ncbi:MAG: hypothetical protein WC683_20110 [bacterium]
MNWRFWNFRQECGHTFRHDTPVEVGKPRYCPLCNMQKTVTACKESMTARILGKAMEGQRPA